MFLFSPKFDWSFSHLSIFNWGCRTLPKCSYFNQMFIILPKMFLKFFSWPKFGEGCWNYHMIPVDSRACSVYFAIRGKNGILPFWPLFFCWIGYFASVWKTDTTLLTCECYYITCPNFENFCPNNGQFFSVGNATASPASPCRTLMSVRENVPVFKCEGRFNFSTCPVSFVFTVNDEVQGEVRFQG